MTNCGGKHTNRDWLQKQIEKKERSLEDVANEVKKQPRTIRYWINKFDLELHWKHSKIKDERGNEYGNLVVKEFSHIDKHRRAVWICEHKKGYNFKAAGIHLRNGEVNGEHSQPPGQSAFEYIYRRYKRQARNRDLAFKLTKEQFKKLTQQNCHYCGKPPSNTTNIASLTFNGNFTYSSLDRVDNSKGYTQDNVVPCCDTCNRFKGSMDRREFLSLVEKIYKNFPHSD